MSIITTTELGTYLGETLDATQLAQAEFAIQSAVNILSGLLCYNVDPRVISSNTIPAKLSPIGAGSCGTISAGKFKVFSLNNLTRMQLEPFTGSVRQVILVPQGVNFAGTNTCNAGIRFVQTYEFNASFNGKKNETYFNRFDMCASSCMLSAYECMSCYDVYVDADWGWGASNAELPAGIKAAALGIAKDLFYGQSNGGLKSESIEGHSYTMSDAGDYKQTYAGIRSLYGACSLNAL